MLGRAWRPRTANTTTSDTAPSQSTPTALSYNARRHAVGRQLESVCGDTRRVKKVPVGYLSQGPFLGTVPASSWLVALREVPACESNPWSQHSHDAAGTSTSTQGPAFPRCRWYVHQ